MFYSWDSDDALRIKWYIASSGPDVEIKIALVCTKVA